MRGAVQRRLATTAVFQVIEAAAQNPAGEVDRFEADCRLRPDEQPIVDALARECGLQVGRPEFFRLRRLLALMVAGVRMICDLGSIAVTLEEIADKYSGVQEDEFDHFANEFAEVIDVEAKEEFGLSEDKRAQIGTVIHRYIVDSRSAFYTRQMDEAEEAISRLADTLNIPVERRADLREVIFQFILSGDEATGPPRPDMPPELVAAMLKDSILGRLHQKFEKQLREIELPEGGFTTIEQARAGGALAKTFHDLQKRREKLGLPPMERPDRVTEAATMAAYYYDRHTETGEFIPPRPRGRPRKTEAAPAT
jgi:hypothetical protein